MGWGHYSGDGVMAQIPGGVVSGDLHLAFRGAPRQGARQGAVAGHVSGATIELANYKNEGYYAAGTVWETWITSGEPQTVPPSGHTLTFVQHHKLT